VCWRQSGDGRILVADPAPPPFCINVSRLPAERRNVKMGLQSCVRSLLFCYNGNRERKNI
jgi:hypothetical protein